MRKAVIALLLGPLFYLASPLFAAETNPPRASESEEMLDEMAQELADFSKEAGAELSAFRDERDREFALFLREQWQAYKELAAQVAYSSPKPKTLPTAPVSPLDRKYLSGKKLPLPGEQKAPTLFPLPKTVDSPTTAPVLSPLATPQPPGQKPTAYKPQPGGGPSAPQTPPSAGPAPARRPLQSFLFYGATIRLPVDPALRTPVPLPITNQTISQMWEIYGSADFFPLIVSLDSYKKELCLNDWAFYLLVHDVAAQLVTKENNVELLSWFILTKSGYQCKIGFKNERIFLLASVKPLLFNTVGYQIEGANYYNLTLRQNGGSADGLFTHTVNYPGATRPISLALNENPRVAREPFERALAFKYENRDYRLTFTGNRYSINFLERYPQTDFPIFFKANLSPEAEESLLTGLRPLVAGKSEAEAVNLLLRFVQTAFTYKTDEEQFGREKYLFVEETLYFPYSDCEDRSFIFSYLVRKLVGLEVVGLLYPGHMATAVRFNDKLEGDAILSGNSRYLICDPTYINANIGKAMPQYRTVTPKLILTQR